MVNTIAPPKSLGDSAVVVTGGTSGVGLATAKALVAAGARRVALIGRNKERGAAAVKAVEAVTADTKVLFISADANTLPGATHAIEAALEGLGGIDVLINSTAASYLPKLLFNIPPEEVLDVMYQLISAPLLMSRLVLPTMREQKGGVIINIASDAAKVPTPGETVIGAGMAAIVSFTRTLAIEGKRDGIRANVLTPSLITDTDLSRRVMDDPFASKIFGTAIKLANLGVATPEDIAGLIVYLASPQAAKLTGQAISLNGGISAA